MVRSQAHSWARRFALGIATLLLPVVWGCGGGDAQTEFPSATGAAPPPCTLAAAPFAKVMNPGTSGEFAACTVTVEAEFNSPDWGAMVGGDIGGYVKWSAVPRGGAAPAGPLGVDFKLMYIPKAKSDAIFALKKGDAIVVKGVTRTSAIGQVTFFASEVRAANGP